MTDNNIVGNESEPVMGIPVGQQNNVNKLAVISEGFCVPHEVVFVLQFNLNPRSTEIYSIVDSAGTPQFRVYGLSTSGSAMHIVDKEGHALLTLKSKSFSAHNKWYIFTGDSTSKGDKIATVKPSSGSTSAEIFLKGRAQRHSGVNDKHAPPDFVMEGNRSVTYGKISHQEDGYAVPVAEINKIKKPTLGRNQPIPSHIDSYSLHTLPGIDSLFMLAVTVALDESIFSPHQMQSYGYPGYGRMGYGGMGYGGMGYGYGAPMLMGGALLGASPFLLGGFW